MSAVRSAAYTAFTLPAACSRHGHLFREHHHQPESEKIQSLLNDPTAMHRESYSGIRVIKSFVQEKAMQGFWKEQRRVP